MKNVRFAFLGLLFAAGVANAKGAAIDGDQCNGEEANFSKCYDAVFYETLSEKPANGMEESVKDKMAPAAAEGSASALRDFLPAFLGALGIPGLSENDEDGSLVLMFNLPRNSLGGGVIPSFKITARDPMVYMPLSERFTREKDEDGEDVPEELKMALEGKLEELKGEVEGLDDVEIELSLSRLSEKHGRDFSYHRVLYQRLWTEAAQSRGLNPSSSTELLQFLTVLDPRCGDLENGKFSTLEENCPEQFDELKRRIAEAATVHAKSFERIKVEAVKGKYDRLDDLVNNQPQYFFSAIYRDRSELSGPDEISAKFTYELGLMNVNGLRKHCKKEGNAEINLGCLSGFLNKGKTDPALSRRFSFSAEYTEIDPYMFNLMDFDPESDVDLDFERDGSEKLIGMLAYGIQLRPNGEDGRGGYRLDLEASYEDISDNPDKNDRFVSTLTYTQQISKEMAAAVTLIYANKPEFRGDVDVDLGVRAGFKLTLDKKEKNGNGG